MAALIGWCPWNAKAVVTQAASAVAYCDETNHLESIWRALVETGFIVFLFYSNLLMGEFTQSGLGRGRGLAWAIQDIFTAANFVIAVIAALIGYALVEVLRDKSTK